MRSYLQRITAAGFAAGVITSAPVAHADAGSYLQDLTNYGLTVNNAEGAVNDGYKVCAIWAEHRASLADIVTALQYDNPGLSRRDADLEVRAAFNNLCPEASR